MRWFDGARTRLRLLFARRAAESRMNKEFRFHIEMETDRLMREKGLAPEEARRQALAAFGGVEKHKEALRDGRGFAWLSGFSLNVKLGARMLAKYPGVTIVGGSAEVVALLCGLPARRPDRTRRRCCFSVRPYATVRPPPPLGAQSAGERRADGRALLRIAQGDSVTEAS